MKINKEQLKKLLREGLNDTECAKILKVHNATVSHARAKMGIEKNFKYSTKVNLKLLKQYYYEGLSDSKIAEKLRNVKGIGVYYWRTKLGLKANPKQFPKHTISKEQHQILIGTLLGDGCLTKLHNNTRIDFAHTIKQKEWFLWKYERLKPFVWDYKIRTYENDRYKNPITEIRAKTRVHPLLNSYHTAFYNKGVKIVPRELFKQLTPLGLAVWFMDDGSETQLCTNSFNKNDLEYIVEELNAKFNISFTIMKSGALYIPVSERKVLSLLIKPHIISSMQYKLSL